MERDQRDQRRTDLELGVLAQTRDFQGPDLFHGRIGAFHPDRASAVNVLFIRHDLAVGDQLKIGALAGIGRQQDGNFLHASGDQETELMPSAVEHVDRRIGAESLPGIWRVDVNGMASGGDVEHAQTGAGCPEFIDVFFAGDGEIVHVRFVGVHHRDFDFDLGVLPGGTGTEPDLVFPRRGQILQETEIAADAGFHPLQRGLAGLDRDELVQRGDLDLEIARGGIGPMRGDEFREIEFRLGTVLADHGHRSGKIGDAAAGTAGEINRFGVTGIRGNILQPDAGAFGRDDIVKAEDPALALAVVELAIHEGDLDAVLHLFGDPDCIGAVAADPAVFEADRAADWILAPVGAAGDAVV